MWDGIGMGTASSSAAWSGVCRGPVRSPEIGLFLHRTRLSLSCCPPASWLGPDEGYRGRYHLRLRYPGLDARRERFLQVPHSLHKE
jgi:hypothetical protein